MNYAIEFPAVALDAGTTVGRYRPVFPVQDQELGCADAAAAAGDRRAGVAAAGAWSVGRMVFRKSPTHPPAKLGVDRGSAH
jgi:hypothetical protein